jgi:hypothetical protein
MQPIDAVSELFLGHTAEHLAIVVIGAFMAWLGYRLFCDMPLRQQGEAKIHVPGGISIILSRLGPGIFFALFGTSLIGYTVAQQATYHEIVSQAGLERQVRGFGPESTQKGTPGGSFDDIVDTIAPNALPIEQLVADLASIATEAPPKTGSDVERERTLMETRARLMLHRWNDDWGNREGFAAWVFKRGAQAPPPQDAAGALKVFFGR